MEEAFVKNLATWLLNLALGSSWLCGPSQSLRSKGPQGEDVQGSAPEGHIPLHRPGFSVTSEGAMLDTAMGRLSLKSGGVLRLHSLALATESSQGW